MVFRTISNHMLSYIEQQQKINANGTQSNKKIHAPVQRQIFFGNFGFLPNLKKQKCYFIKRIDWEHTLEKKYFMPRYL